MNARKALPLTFWFAIGWSAAMSLGLVLSASANAAESDLELVLRLQGRVSMETLAQNVTDPASPRYQQFYTPDEIRQLAGPSDFDYQQTLTSVQAHGLRVVSVDRTHLFLTVAGAQADVEKTFSTTIQFDGSGGHHHHAIQQTVIPHDLPLVRSVIGIDNTRQSRPLSRALASSPRHVISGDVNGDPTAGLQPDQIQDTYGFNPLYQKGLTGKGQHIAVATYFMFETDDPPQYWAQKDIQPTPQLDVVTFNGTSDIDDDAESETELDSEFSGMIAPGAMIHVFPSSHNDDSGEVQLFTAILDDNRAKVANYSWGDCEADIDQQHFQDMNQVFARAVAQGVNVMVAAGDWGSYGCPTDDDSGDGAHHARTTPGKVNADWPAANPYVVAVGGTSIDSADEGGNVKEEAWDSTGGGVSAVYAQPSWQKGFVGAFTMRAFPDVAFNADPNTGEVALVHYENQLSWLQFGGTSIAAPQWAGFLALVGEARGAKGPVGFINPIIYALSAQQKALALHDVTKGNNGAYSAGAGWDATTGWGSMNASQLLAILAAH